jgi:hypothetical protein
VLEISADCASLSLPHLSPVRIAPDGLSRVRLLTTSPGVLRIACVDSFSRATEIGMYPPLRGRRMVLPSAIRT